jgi:hypothetical protein
MFKLSRKLCHLHINIYDSRILETEDASKNADHILKFDPLRIPS